MPPKQSSLCYSSEEFSKHIEGANKEYQPDYKENIKLSPALVERINAKIVNGGAIDEQDIEDIQNEVSKQKPKILTDPNPLRG